MYQIFISGIVSNIVSYNMVTREARVSVGMLLKYIFQFISRGLRGKD